MTSERDPSPPPPHPAAPGSHKPVLPALLYVLGAFGIVAGVFGAQQAIGTAVILTGSREEYVELTAKRNEPLKAFVAADVLQRYSTREADVRYARRNAALPLAGVGIILSLLLFGGALRAMRGDAWGLSAWTLAAVASIPYELISTALTMATAHEMRQAVQELPMAQAWIADLQLAISFVMCGVALLYYAACLIYLRTARVRRCFSDDAGRTPPSA